MNKKWQDFSLGITQLSKRAVIKVEGADAKTFLQGQLTCDLNQVSGQQSLLGAHCNLKGRVQSLFRIIEAENAYWLLLPKDLLPSALLNLKKYAIFSKVVLSAVDDKFIFGVAGKEARASISKEEGLIVCQVPGDLPRFEVITSQEKYQQSATVIPETDWELLDIQAGIPTIYPQTQDLLLPHHINLTNFNGIGFNKGCYLGQEIIARMHYKGKIKRHMYRGQVTQDASAQELHPGDQIIILDAPNEAPGVVVRASPCPEGFEILMVLDEQYADCNQVRLNSADGPQVHRLNLPYVI